MSTNKTQGIEMSDITPSSCHNRIQKYFNITQAELHKDIKRLHAAVNGRTKVKEQRREIQEVGCRFEGFDAEQPSRTTRRLFPKRTSI
ncbi:BnaC08g10260D [Brassica napus]|uniref:BnaC08g10260D protein n=1 Tax=Brassica napus TaxID=3708 RepID=A0A078F7J6_BRANA|nr:BnaC08g10260D [Brassica napus]